MYKRFSVVKVLFVSYFFEAVPLYKFNCEKISDQFFLYFFVFAKPFFIIIHSIDFDDSYTLENRTVNEKKITFDISQTISIKKNQPEYK